MPRKYKKTKKESAEKKALAKNDKPVKRTLHSIRNKMTKKHSKTKNKEIEKGLKTIYRETKGKKPNLTKLDHKKTPRVLILIISLIIFLGIIFGVSILGFLVFQPSAKFVDKKVNLEIKAPFSAISGEKIVYEIKYTNAEEISLTNVRLDVYLPNGFIFEKSNIEPIPKEETETETYSNVKTWQINDLFCNQSNKIVIEGQMIGMPDSKQTISATLSYTPANFSSEFQNNNNFNTEIIDSFIDMELAYPSQTANEEETEFEIDITNTSEKTDLANLEVELIYPAEFTLNESKIIHNDEEIILTETDQDDENTNLTKTWTINNLYFQNKSKIVIKGIFNVEDSQELNLQAITRLKGPSDEYFNQAQEDFKINVIKGELLTNLIIQGSNKNKPVDFNNTLNYLLLIQNKSKDPLGDLKIRAVLDSALLDWSSLNDSNNGILDNHQILWTQDQISDLALLLPEEEIEIAFQIDLKEYHEVKNLNADKLKVTSFFESQINSIKNTNTNITNESNTIINEINTNVNLTAYGRYFSDNDNTTIGSGPLPPIVNQTTNYKIFWEINNSLHEIRNIEVKTKIPNTVKFVGQEKTSSGTLFVNQDNEIIWQISRIPTSVNNANAEFEISITPSSNDVHKILTLLPEILLKSTDSQTKAEITRSVSGITTNLEQDPLAEGKGLVQEEEEK